MAAIEQSRNATTMRVRVGRSELEPNFGSISVDDSTRWLDLEIMAFFMRAAGNILR